MKIIFLSNHFNHHQKPLSEALYLLTNKQYLFVETEKMSEERIKMGWAVIGYPDYVISCSELLKNKDYYLSLINNADIVITGSAPESYVINRLKLGKLTFRYSERIYKRGCSLWKLPIRVVKYYFRHGRYDNLYMLCASAYAAADYVKTYTFLDKTYKWGYFPETRIYPDIRSLIVNKEKNAILWTARFIDLKHPEIPIEIAKMLRDEGYNFKLRIIGDGILKNNIQTMIKKYQLENYVEMLGVMSPESVRKYMEQSEIFLFTSDFNEGWGAVLNESMNSGCAVVASHAIGSVPFLIKNNINGYIYKNGNSNQLYKYVKNLLDTPDKRIALGVVAYNTIEKTWNATVAAERLLILAKKIQQNCIDHIFEDGPCSRAGVLKNNWIDNKLFNKKI